MVVSLRRAVWVATPFLVVIVAAAAVVFGVVNGIERFHRGIYAGFHYVDARSVAVNAMIANYGEDFVNRSRFAIPPVVNTHQHGLLNDGQVRIFHIIGPRGTHYCVSVWNPRSNWTAQYANGASKGINIGGSYTIKPRCSFQTSN